MSPSAMTEIAEHLERCSIAAQQLIFGEIAKRGENKAAVPFNMSFDGSEWWVYLDVNMPAGTFDVETHSERQIDALNNALSRLRRSFSVAAA